MSRKANVFSDSKIFIEGISPVTCLVEETRASGEPLVTLDDLAEDAAGSHDCLSVCCDDDLDGCVSKDGRRPVGVGQRGALAEAAEGKTDFIAYAFQDFHHRRT